MFTAHAYMHACAPLKIFSLCIYVKYGGQQVGDLNACASQLDHGFTMTDAQFYVSNWSKWIRGMLGLGSPDPPRFGL